MDVGSLFSPQGGQGVSIGQDTSTYRNADFMAVMLSEITNQDPLQPSETSKIVEGMRQLQELSNSQYRKFREDMQWAQDLLGEEIAVRPGNYTEAQIDKLKERGINPATGVGLVTGTVENYKIMGESVWVTIEDQDYAIDDVQRIVPSGEDPLRLSGMADHLLGKRARYVDESGQFTEGVVDELRWSQDGSVRVIIDGESVDFGNLLGVRL